MRRPSAPTGREVCFELANLPLAYELCSVLLTLTRGWMVGPLDGHRIEQVPYRPMPTSDEEQTFLRFQSEHPMGIRVSIPGINRISVGQAAKGRTEDSKDANQGSKRFRRWVS
mmetsp:Transcript_2744/g.17109  ORF Transcript_2744/g.17109 Transcript_2744/m.17109 type:complete len:113 (+) Transcript_2744:1000-1338(+)